MTMLFLGIKLQKQESLEVLPRTGAVNFEAGLKKLLKRPPKQTITNL